MIENRVHFPHGFLEAFCKRNHIRKLSLFGSEPAVGRSFVFVIDRSSSMSSRSLGAIQLAAKELAAKLDFVFGQRII